MATIGLPVLKLLCTSRAISNLLELKGDFLLCRQDEQVVKTAN